MGILILIDGWTWICLWVFSCLLLLSLGFSQAQVQTSSLSTENVKCECKLCTKVVNIKIWFFYDHCPWDMYEKYILLEWHHEFMLDAQFSFVGFSIFIIQLLVLVWGASNNMSVGVILLISISRPSHRYGKVACVPQKAVDQCLWIQVRVSLYNTFYR